MMRKRILTVVAILTMVISPAMAQIFMDDDAWNDNRLQTEAPNLGVMVPSQDSHDDQYPYVPIGEGLVLLVGLGLTYWFGTHKRDE